jgi:hypothetical protein
MSDWKSKLPQYWDKLAALFGAVLLLLNALIGLDFWSETWQRWISVAIGAVTAAAVWLKRNVNVAERITGVDIDQDADVGQEGGKHAEPPIPHVHHVEQPPAETEAEDD